jgi:phosphoribosylformylglycinamidine (FGAM) synthase-like enzyme
MRDCLGRAEGAPPTVDLMAERRNGDFIRSAIRNALVTSCHDISSGGLAWRWPKWRWPPITAWTSISPSHGPSHALLFGEDQARYVVTVPSELSGYIMASAEGAGVPFRHLGKMSGDSLTINGLFSLPVSTLRATHESWFPAFMDVPETLAAE